MNTQATAETVEIQKKLAKQGLFAFVWAFVPVLITGICIYQLQKRVSRSPLSASPLQATNASKSTFSPPLIATLNPQSGPLPTEFVVKIELPDAQKLIELQNSVNKISADNAKLQGSMDEISKQLAQKQSNRTKLSGQRLATELSLKALIQQRNSKQTSPYDIEYQINAHKLSISNLRNKMQSQEVNQNELQELEEKVSENGTAAEKETQILSMQLTQANSNVVGIQEKIALDEYQLRLAFQTFPVDLLRINELNRIISIKRSDLRNAQTLYTKIDMELKKATEKLDKLKKEYKDTISGLDTQKKSLNSLRFQITREEQSVAELENEKNKVRSDTDKLKDQISDRERELNKQDDELQKADEEIQALTLKLEALKKNRQ